jgi:hypothetical protein
MDTITINKWGKDHWSLLAFMGVICTDYKGNINEMNMRRMRCNPSRHPLNVTHTFGSPALMRWQLSYSTIIKSGAVIHDHDDWDCLDDLEAEGLLENIGTLVNPMIVMTEQGWDILSKLNQHKASGGKYRDFVV